MSRIARPVCVFALGLVLSVPVAPAAHAALRAEDGLAGALAAWYGRLVQLLEGHPLERRGGGDARVPTSASDRAWTHADADEPESSSGSDDPEEADNGPMIEPNG